MGTESKKNIVKIQSILVISCIEAFSFYTTKTNIWFVLQVSDMSRKISGFYKRYFWSSVIFRRTCVIFQKFRKDSSRIVHKRNIYIGKKEITQDSREYFSCSSSTSRHKIIQSGECTWSPLCRLHARVVSLNFVYVAHTLRRARRFLGRLH